MRSTNLLVAVLMTALLAGALVAAPVHKGTVPSSSFIPDGFTTLEGFRAELNTDSELRARYSKIWGEKWETLGPKMSHLVMGEAPDGEYSIAIRRDGKLVWTRQYLKNEKALGFWLHGEFVPVILADCGNPAIKVFPCPPKPASPKKEIKETPPPKTEIKPPCPPEEKPVPEKPKKKVHRKKPCPPPTKKLLVKSRGIINTPGDRKLVINPGIIGKITPVVKWDLNPPETNIQQHQEQRQDNKGGDVVIDNDNSTNIHDDDTIIVDDHDVTNIDVDASSSASAAANADP